MKAILQRVLKAHVSVADEVVGKIDAGWLILLGIKVGDTFETAEFVADRCFGLRGFSDEHGKMNLSLSQVSGAILVVSQFTLYGDCNRGRRPSFDEAAPGPVAQKIYEHFCRHLQTLGCPVEQGIFQADMQVSLVNDGPVTLIIEK